MDVFILLIQVLEDDLEDLEELERSLKAAPGAESVVLHRLGM